MTVLHAIPATASAIFERVSGASPARPQFRPATLLAAGANGALATQAAARRAAGGFASTTNILVIIGVVLVVVALLALVLIRRSPDADGTGRDMPRPDVPRSDVPQPASRPGGPPTHPQASGWPPPAQAPRADRFSAATLQQDPPWPLQRQQQPLPQRLPAPPDSVFGLADGDSAAARHRAADPPTPAAMLSNKALLTGTVTGPDSYPVSGARLTVSDFHGSTVGIGHTAVDGRYRLHLPTGGTYVVACSIDGRESSTTMITVAVPTLVCDMTLGARSEINGRVRHQQGAPAAGATVTVTDLRGEVITSTLSDSGGAYRLIGLNAGEYTLVASAIGARPSASTVQVPASGVRQVDVVLQSNGALRGTVRAANSARPVLEASVALVDGSGGVIAASLTGADGEYVFAEVPPGGYTLVASGYPPVATWIELTGHRTEVRDLVLGGGGSESGGSIAAEAPGATVAPQPRTEPGPEQRWTG